MGKHSEVREYEFSSSEEVTENERNVKLPLKTPNSVWFIIFSECCERYTYYATRSKFWINLLIFLFFVFYSFFSKSVLTVFLMSVLLYNEQDTEFIYHLYQALGFTFPLVGSVIADSWLGKYKTIVYFSFVYLLGNILLFLSSFSRIQILSRVFTSFGLIFITIGAGSVKPCMSAFGGDQFILPQQKSEVQKFFSKYYTAMNVGSMVAFFFSPIARQVHCLQNSSCFPLAFGLPVVFLVLSIVLFLTGNKWYVVKIPKKNVIFIFFQCILRALRNKFNHSSESTKEHWLDYAEDKFSKQDIYEVRRVLNILSLFTAAPLFWSLSDQQGSTWLLQALNMDGRVNSVDYFIKADQMLIFNPLVIIIMVPIFEVFLYSKLETLGLKRPLQKMILGSLVATVAFAMSTHLEMQVKTAYHVKPRSGNGNLRIFNVLDCTVKIDSIVTGKFELPSLSVKNSFKAPVNTTKIGIEIEESCPYQLKNEPQFIKVLNKLETSYFIIEESGIITVSEVIENITSPGIRKPIDGNVSFRFYYTSSLKAPVKLVTFGQNSLNKKSKKKISFSMKLEPNTLTQFFEFPWGIYDFSMDNRMVMTNTEIPPGEVDTFLIRSSENNTMIKAEKIEIIHGNKIHILWILPQIITITIAEILFVVTGLEFAITEAPESMKVVVSAGWLLTDAIGNYVVAIIAEIQIFENSIYLFVFYTVLMLLDSFFLIFLSMRYDHLQLKSI